jgi:hypothetical protein
MPNDATPASRLISDHGREMLARAAAFFLAAGFAARFLLLDDVHPVVESTGIGLLLIGSGLVLFGRAAAGGAVAGSFALLMPPLLAWAARSLEPLALKRAIDVWAACMAGFAIRDLVRDGGLGPSVRRAAVAAAATLGVFGIAQTLYLRRDAAAAAHEMDHALTMTELGRAFLESRRAGATFISPNAFAGFLLLFGFPVVLAAAATIAGPRGRREKLLAAVLALIVLAAFACAGSAGATVAGVVGGLFVGWRAARGKLRPWLLAATIAAVAVAVGITAVAVSKPEASGKLKTLQQRVDYHKVGLRLLDDTFPEGAGLEQTRRLTAEATARTEAFSRSLHDWWLQGLVEGGIVFLPVAALFLIAIARGVRAAAAREAHAEGGPAAKARPLAATWRRGLAAGLVLALILQPFATILPYGFAHPIVHAAAMVGLAWLLATAAIRWDPGGPAFDLGVAAGCVAFALHGIVDYDLYVPGAMLAFATALALLPGRNAAESPRAAPIARGLTMAYGIASLLAPVAVMLLAATREHAH